MLSIAVAILLSACSGEGDKTVTANGYEYQHHIKNDGPKPQIGQYAYFSVQMRNPTTGKVTYDSKALGQSPKIQITDAPPPANGQKASPVLDALKLMSIGDSLTVFMPLDSVPRKPKDYEDATALAYDMVLLELKSAEEYQAEYEAERAEMERQRAETTARLPEVKELSSSILADYTSGKLDDKIQTTASGLKYIIHEEGTGAKPAQGQQIKAHYYGTLTNGDEFDASFNRGQTFNFAVGAGQVIKGWDEGFMLLNEGSKATLFVPANLGYGATPRSSIPANSELVFYVELVEIM